MNRRRSTLLCVSDPIEILETSSIDDLATLLGDSLEQLADSDLAGCVYVAGCDDNR